MAARVLVVEDSPTQAQALKALLESDEYSVTVAGTGNAGLAAFQQSRFDVVISDIVMPGSIDGYELCRRIKTGGSGPPVVLVTSLSDPLEVIHALQCGADSFLTKPYEPDHLLERLRTLMATSASRQSAPPSAGLTVLFMGREYTIRSRPQQILDLLIATFEDAVLQNKELRRREEVLEATHNELQAFTYAISHDLRAPLRHVSAFSQFLMEEFSQGLDPTALDYVQRIRRAVEQMDGMVNAILHLGRVGRREMKREMVDLTSLVGDQVSQLAASVRDRRVDWQVDALPVVDCDRELIGSVFLNLLSNALKFTRDCDPAVIQVRHSIADGQVNIEVTDNGVGFDMAHADRLFAIFQRLHRPDEFEGTGVGLATVQRIILKHGGRVWATGKLGQGATVGFSWPGARGKA